MNTKKECEERESKNCLRKVSKVSKVSIVLLMSILFYSLAIVNVSYALDLPMPDTINNNMNNTFNKPFNNSFNNSFNNNIDINVDTQYLSLEKYSYSVGELLTINLLSKNLMASDISEFSLDIMNINAPENSFRYLGLLENTISFIPNNEGEYFIKLYDGNGSIIDEINFYVNAQGECIDLSNIDLSNSGNIIISSENLIGVSSVVIVHKDIFSGNQQRFIYRGDMNSEIVYAPKINGIYEVYLDNDYISCYSVGFMSENYYSGSYSNNPQNLQIKKDSPIRIIDSKNQELNSNLNIRKYRGRAESAENLSGGSLSGGSLSGGSLSGGSPDNLTLSYTPDSEQLIEDESYDLDLEIIGPVDSIRFKELRYRNDMKIGVDKIISKQKIDNKSALEIFAIDLYDLEFAESEFYKRAVGSELYKCKDWNFTTQSCFGTWQKIMDLTPGEYYNVSLYPGDPGFAELGLASVNTDKSIYRPGESAEITIVVLDNQGFLVNDADVVLNVTSPGNFSQIFSTSDNTITKSSDGIYKAYYYSIFEEGTYNMNVYAIGNNVNNTMQSYFIAQYYYDFDILRESPVVVDPWRSDFISKIKIISYNSINTSDTFNFTESLPESFTVTDYGGAIESYSAGKILLTWYDLTNGSVINYSALPPLITPELYDLRSYVEYVDSADNLQKIFEEARPWYLAVDPSFYYDPTSTLLAGWTTGTGTTHAEIDDATRYSAIPDLNNYVRQSAGTNSPSQFKFNTITESSLDYMRLWIYTGTGSNAVYTFSLRQGGTTMCSRAMTTNSATTWYNCTWTNPTGDFSNISVYLSGVTKSGGGSNQPATVYAAYLEVYIANLPPVVNLTAPQNNTVVNYTPIHFNFTAIDGESSTLANCSLWGNFTGSYGVVATRNNVANNTNTNISYSPNDGNYLWNVQCYDTNKTSFSPVNYTLKVNAIPPVIRVPRINVTEINQSESVRFNVSINDSFGISYAYATLRYPNGSLLNLTLSNTGTEFYTIFSDTTRIGVYNITSVWANDTLGQVSSNNTINRVFTVTASPPTAFNLFHPLNNSVSSNLLPRFNWTQTTDATFNNYTLLLDKDSTFATPDYRYYTFQITNTSYLVNFALDANTIYYWRVIAYDTFSNSRNSTQDFIYTTDTLGPSVTLNTPGDNTFWTSTLITFNYTPNDANSLDACVLYANFSGAFQQNVSNNTLIKGQFNYLTTIVNTQGFYRWNVMCNDTSGNSNFAAANYTLNLDLAGPNVYLMYPQNNTRENTTNVITFGANATDAISELSQCILILNNEIKDTKYDLTNNAPFNFTVFVSNGHYNWSVNCTDINGFTSSSLNRNLTVNVVDTEAPLITLNYPAANSFLAMENITFNYTPEDATGIENCSIYIDGSYYDVDFIVENFMFNYFDADMLSEGVHNWTISCYDNSSEYNYYIAPTINFTIDLGIPEITLNAPFNNAFVPANVLFNYTATDNYLQSCALYGNFTGTWLPDQYNDSVTSGMFSYFSKTLPDGVYVWNVWCNHSAGTYAFAPQNYTIKVDSTPPYYSNVVSYPFSPTNFSPSTTYYFNITWNDNFNVDTVIIEHNFTGARMNQTITSGNTNYSLITMNLVPGIYSYKWYANDSRNNQNVTGTYTYIVNKSLSNITVLFNGTNANTTIDEGGTSNITAKLNNPQTGSIELYMNGQLINNGSSPLINITLFTNPGLYNITTVYNGNQNYTYVSDTKFLTVRDNKAPNITLIYPENNTLLASGIIPFQFNISDGSEIKNCSIIINGVLNATNISVNKSITQYFYISIAQDTYTWNIRCYDVYDNLGVSLSRNFSAIDTDTIIVNVDSVKSSYEKGEMTNIETYTESVLGNPLQTDVTTYIVGGNTSLYWWNTAWKKRMPITITENTGQNWTNAIVYMNITGLNNSISSCINELRLIRNSSADTSEIPLTVISGDNANHCYIGFRVNINDNKISRDYAIYYNNSAATNPNYGLNFEVDYTYFATASATDEGAPTNVVNILGNNDATFATFSLSGGGAAAQAAHGRGFINLTPATVITKVQARYRYEIPTMSISWELRYSVDDGAAYSNAFVGTATMPKTTSTWVDLTSNYASLTWTELNRTRLQARISKGGGGGAGTLYLYWVEMNVTVRSDASLTQTTLGQEQILYSYNSTTTSLSGLTSYSFDSHNYTIGNYSAIGRATLIDYKNSTGFGTFEITADITPPNITLISPYNFEQRGVGMINFSYMPYDINLNNCTLYIGKDGSFIQNQTHTTPLNNDTNTFDAIYLGIGLYTWNVLCYDTYNNSGFAPANFTLNITGSDITAYADEIWFSDVQRIEGNNITVFANITNIGLSANNESFTVQFYMGDPGISGTQINGDKIIGVLQPEEVETINVSFLLNPGVNNIFILIDTDDLINESDESNNKVNATVNVELYQYYYGNVTADIILGSGQNKSIVAFGNITTYDGYLFIADQDSVFSFANLQALGRNKNDLPTADDFSEVDEILNTTSFYDSINSIWTNNTNVPLETAQLNMSSKIIYNVPIVNTTTTNYFSTGILWDTTDDLSLNDQYDSTDGEDVVFVTQVKIPIEGEFGIYSYEIKVPAKLREYKGASDMVDFYYELK